MTSFALIINRYIQKLWHIGAKCEQSKWDNLSSFTFRNVQNLVLLKECLIIVLWRPPSKNFINMETFLSVSEGLLIYTMLVAHGHCAESFLACQTYCDTWTPTHLPGPMIFTPVAENLIGSQIDNCCYNNLNRSLSWLGFEHSAFCMRGEWSTTALN